MCSDCKHLTVDRSCPHYRDIHPLAKACREFMPPFLRIPQPAAARVQK